MAKISWKSDSEIQAEREEALVAKYTALIQRYLDQEALQRGYDNIFTLCTYATSKHPKFAAEGQAGVEWRDAVWATGAQLLEDVKAGRRAIPTEEEVLALLPKIQWPQFEFEV